MDLHNLSLLCKQVRYYILTSTTQAGSGHPTSSLSAVELITTLFFGGYLKYDINNPHSHLNDRMILSKGHAAPLLYALWTATGAISKEEMLTLRQFGSRLEGHPTPVLPYVDVATGSLGQGLSVGVGMALALKNIVNKPQTLNLKSHSNSKSQISNGQNNLGFRVSDLGFATPNIYVLLGDSELAEGQNWEAMQLASYYKLNNLIGILDVNRLGQRGETMLGWDIKTYQKRIESFGWKTILIEDGHNITKIASAFHQSLTTNLQSPTMLIAKTIKGKDISFLENQEGWHGKVVPKERLQEALAELGRIDWTAHSIINKPETQSSNVKYQIHNLNLKSSFQNFYSYTKNAQYSTREAYGDALVSLGGIDKRIIVLDAETSNSTYAEKFKKEFPDRFFEMFIAEQNMVSAALGFSKIGFIPFVSSFAAFLTRAFDQIRMSQYSIQGRDVINHVSTTLNIIGSHAGCSIGPDGASQMALEDISMMRSIRESTVLYPSDAVSTAKLTSLLVNNPGISYLRLTREKTPIVYNEREEFRIGRLKIIEITNNKLQITSQFQITNNKYSAVIIAAGITLHEALKAQKQLAEKGKNVVVIDLYCVKPLDEKTILDLAKQTNHIVVVEDHYPAGGIGEAVSSVLTNYPFNNNQGKQSPIANLKFTHLCVRKLPHSGKLEELLRYEKIDAEAIIKSVTSPLPAVPSS